MSIYYYFACEKCKQCGGIYTTQAWGTGNADLIETFKFVMYHAVRCGTESIQLLSEHNYDNYEPTNEGEARKSFIKETAHIFPCSDDWKFMEDMKDKDAAKEWVLKALRECL